MATISFDRSAQRASPFDLLSRLGTGLVSFVARTTASSGKGGKPVGVTDGEGAGGSAAPATTQAAGATTTERVAAAPNGCCDLYYPYGPWCPYIQYPKYFYCPQGWTRTYWYCVTATYRYGCGECNKGPTCWQAPFHCSQFWWDGPS